MEKLYVVTRADLSPGARAAQAVHAAIEFALEHPISASVWSQLSHNLVVLEARDEAALTELLERARAGLVPCSFFREPDLGGELTAVALRSMCSPAARKLTSRLPLALKQKPPAATPAECSTS